VSNKIRLTLRWRIFILARGIIPSTTMVW
jgi:hypothetical protein